MFVLTKLLQDGKTVVFESSSQRMFWVLKPNGSYLKEGRATAVNPPELKNRETIHIFDAKAGTDSYEIADTRARLLVNSSTNPTSYTQTIRRANMLTMVFPSTTENEFYKYAAIFKIDEVTARQVATVCGFGKIRSLRQKNPQNAVETALRNLTPEHLRDLTDITNVNSRANPGILLDVLLADKKIGEGQQQIEYLEGLYTYANARWIFSSPYIVEYIGNKMANGAEKFFEQFYLATNGSVSGSKTFGNMSGQVFEYFAPKYIVENGLTCIPVGHKDAITIEAGSLVKKNSDFNKLSDILKNCTDSKTLYHFGRNVEGFDSFNPPNNFFQVTSTTTSKPGLHSLLLTAFRDCCEHLLVTGGNANVIIVVPETQIEQWKGKLQSFDINDVSVVNDINNLENRSSQKQNLMKFNGQRSFDKLPLKTQLQLKNFRQFVGGVGPKHRGYCTSRLNPVHPYLILNFKFTNMLKYI